jgi:hypothetical protein
MRLEVASGPLTALHKKSDTTGFSRVVVQFETNSGLVYLNQDTTDFSRVEVQLLPFSSQQTPKLILHAAQAGGVSVT